MIPRLVPEILPCDAFCDEQEQKVQELGILGVRYKYMMGQVHMQIQIKITLNTNSGIFKSLERGTLHKVRFENPDIV